MATIVSAVQWPDVLKRDRIVSWTPEFQNTVSAPTISGQRQVANLNGGGLWRASFESVYLRTPEQIRAWRAMQIRLQGGLVPIDVPVCLHVQQPFPVASGRPDFASAITVVTVGSTAARAVALRLSITLAGTIAEGQFFSVYDATTYGNRLHMIDTVAAVGGQPAQRDITFWPPLRFALSGGATLEFKSPKCVMALDRSDAMLLKHENRKRGTSDVSFVEVE
jgi:hypothetical protein